MKQITFSEAKLRLDRVGYALRKKHIDGFLYYTLPHDGGSTSYFNTLQQVEEYIQRVESMRELCAELGPIQIPNLIYTCARRSDADTELANCAASGKYAHITLVPNRHETTYRQIGWAIYATDCSMRPSVNPEITILEPIEKYRNRSKSLDTIQSSVL